MVCFIHGCNDCKAKKCKENEDLVCCTCIDNCCHEDNGLNECGCTEEYNKCRCKEGE